MSPAPSSQLRSGYEIVFTVSDYYDGPRSGIANYRGNPHYYECVFDDNNEEYSNIFQLMPVDEESFRLALEDWLARWSEI